MQIKGFSPVERDLIRERTGEGHCYENSAALGMFKCRREIQCMLQPAAPWAPSLGVVSAASDPCQVSPAPRWRDVGSARGVAGANEAAQPAR